MQNPHALPASSFWTFAKELNHSEEEIRQHYLSLHAGSLEDLQRRLNHQWRDQLGLLRIFTHASFVHECPHLAWPSNEQWEFLGDSVVDLAIAWAIVRRFPHLEEGACTKLRGGLANDEHLASLAEKWGLSPLMILGKGEELSGGRSNKHNLANAFESLWGGFAIEAGIGEAVKTLGEWFLHPDQTHLFDWELPQFCNPKSWLQEWCVENFQRLPHYRYEKELQKDGSEIFRVQVKIFQSYLMEDIDASKKVATKRVAEKLMKEIQSYQQAKLNLNEIREKLC